MHTVILGGGYAGLSTAISLRRARPDALITIVDPRSAHLKITRLQQTVRGAIDDLSLPFDALSAQFDVRHIAAEAAIDAASLAAYRGVLPLAGQDDLAFDYLVVAVGSRPNKLKLSATMNCYDLDDISRTGARELLLNCLLERPAAAAAQTAGLAVTVVGAGATGIQFLFELASDPKLRGCRLRLVDTAAHTLTALPPAFDRYVQTRMAAAAIDYCPGTALTAHDERGALLTDIASGAQRRAPSDLALLFVGGRPAAELRANAYGQVLHEALALETIFAAGDCARFSGDGLDTLSAQAAVHKGKAVAANIVAHREGRPLRPYDYRERGYFVSMGALDGVGWFGNPLAVVYGLPALTIKTAVEAQHELLLSGIDTYFGRQAR